jgi:hypothetical protein
MSCPPQHKKHSNEVDEQQLAAAKAFLEQHLQQTDGGGSSAAALAAAAAAGGGSSKGAGSSKGRVKEKHAGELPADVDPITADDYFERSVEFTAWLQETRHQYFNGESIHVLQLGQKRSADTLAEDTCCNRLPPVLLLPGDDPLHCRWQQQHTRIAQAFVLLSCRQMH